MRQDEFRGKHGTLRCMSFQEIGITICFFSRIFGFPHSLICPWRLLLNERNASHCIMRFPRPRVAGFSPLVLLAALALSAGVPTEASANGKGTVAAMKAGGKQVGRASWYGPGFHGKRTASGQRFNQHALTAAHPRLPLGTRARVTNLRNGREVEVTINDRGPHGGGRIIDLSRAAAKRLAMGGVAHVSIEALPN